MRKTVVFSSCEFTRKGMNCIEPCSLITNEILAFTSSFHVQKNVQNIVVDIQPTAIPALRVLSKFIYSGSPIRFIVMVDNAHVPTLRLLQALGVRFILSKKESLENIYTILNSLTLSYYISTNLQTVLEKHQPTPHGANRWSIFNNSGMFTSTEADIILYLCQGMAPRRLARNRLISTKTVSSHKINALKKIGIKNLNAIFKVIK